MINEINGREKYIPSRPFARVRNQEEAQGYAIVDETNPNQTYIGKAVPGIDTNEEGWVIFRVDTVGAITTILFAEGDEKSDKIWDDRLSYNYLRKPI